jgi:hypothetical protein
MNRKQPNVASSGGSLSQNQVALLLAVGTAGLAWVVPGLSQLLLPLQYLNTHLHEFCHAVVASFTGGLVDHIEVHANGSGVTPVAGGNYFLTASAGYIGATALGGLIASSGRNLEAARVVLALTALALMVSLCLWVRGDSVGLASGWMWVVILGILAATLRGLPLLFAVQFLGIELALASFQSLWVLLKVSAITNLQSDATLAEKFSGVPALFWAICWSLLGVVTTIAAIRFLWQVDRSAPMGQARRN